MKTTFLSDIAAYTSRPLAYSAIILLAGIGLFSGLRFNMSVGSGVYLNSPYTTGFMLGMLSLSVVFLATVISGQLLFKEWDVQFDVIIFTTPISKKSFAMGRFFSFCTLTLIFFLIIAAGFVTGQILRDGPEMQAAFRISHYLYPILIFGVINTLITCSMLYFVACVSRKKLLVALSGVMLYVLYMVMLVFSNSPFMAGSLPQSVAMLQLSALTDPFGLSAYFLNSREFTVMQRNTTIVPLSGYLLLNRLIVSSLSLLFVTLGYKLFPFSAKTQSSAKTGPQAITESILYNHGEFASPTPRFNTIAKWRSVLSFTRIDLTYIFKSAALAAASILLLFYTGMEIYAEIEKGIRLPQKYASSGLIATSISENFHLLGLLLTVYFTNDIFWRSHSARFSILERSAFYTTSKIAGHCLSVSTLLLYFTALLILQGLVFQFLYHYPIIDVHAYIGVLIFNTFPLMLLAAFLLLINDSIRNRYVALALSIITSLLVASPLSRKLITHPLLRIFSGYAGAYSEFNGYGIYLASFVQRLILGISLLAILWLIHHTVKSRRIKLTHLWPVFTLAAIGFYSGRLFLQGYIPKDKLSELQAASYYERAYRKYQQFPQPAITDVSTNIALYPGKHAYSIEGTYIIKNTAGENINKILVNFNEDLKILEAEYSSHKEAIKIDSPISELVLKHPLQSGDNARIYFRISYTWSPVNGHQSFNSIMENGSFMRISRYYPQLGYQPSREIKDSLQRKAYALGEATKIKKLEDPRSTINDLIHLDMLISTEQNQTAIGTGELSAHWVEKDRSYFHYRTNEAIPFRFALSSATYQLKSTVHKGVTVNVFYNARHHENVERLINNAKLSLDYCSENFGAYPFKSATFAEISAFTRGFAATAYPAVIFMTEDMIFHANIKADKQQDVINELAGHEISHLWWGTNQIIPDDREGAPMLTETLAMYTEMMLYKKMYGREKMMERVKMHQQIYDQEKGFSENQPLYKVTDENTHISYSKGAVVMVQLSELIGEGNVNKALRNFLHKQRNRGTAPVSTDVINEILEVSDPKHHATIRKMFMKVW